MNFYDVCHVVPTMSVVQSSHNRYFERALSMAGPTPEQDDSESMENESDYSLQSFSLEDLGEEVNDLSDTEGNSPNSETPQLKMVS
jgi:hypothetical protein